MLFIDYVVNLIDIDIELGVFHYHVSMYVSLFLFCLYQARSLSPFASQQETIFPELDTQGFHVVVARWSATARLHVGACG